MPGGQPVSTRLFFLFLFLFRAYAHIRWPPTLDPGTRRDAENPRRWRAVAWWRGRGWGRGWGWWRGWGPWPGKGPWSHLPPWERPGWVLGPGACWRLYGVPGWLAWLRGLLPWGRAPAAPSEEEELRLLEEYKKGLEDTLRSLEERIEELRRRLEKR